MAVEQFQATAHLQSGTQVKVRSRGFEFTLDEPTEDGGTNLGMNPVEALLGALGACQAIVARVYAKRFNVQLDDFWVELEGDLDSDGYMDKADVRCGYSAVRYTYHIKSPSAQADIDAFIAFIGTKCPVGDSLMQSVALQLTGVIHEK
ncbi:OsmC family protein [Denitrificimonas caeni]|uniref:OsmC family protein n=1 Tax=Denitrificimonas caeni TaxID=521720 RepID=UPI001964F61A|nr:OsmC family protein [Denitrificimonas caeni]